MTPVSAAIISLIGGSRLQSCVNALATQAAEVLVVAPKETRLSCPTNATLILVDATVPEKRAIALQAATKPIVAFIEDTCEPSPHWCDAMHGAFADSTLTLACGPVEIAPTLRPQYSALAITEYACFKTNAVLAKGLTGSPCSAFNGANFAVRKDSLKKAPASSYVDRALLDRLTNSGNVVAVAKGGVVYASEDPHGARLSTRYHHGRIYGASTAFPLGPLDRMVVIAKSCASPLVRSFRHIRHAPAWFWRSPATLFWTITMNCAWGVGEFVGAVTGKAGSSLREWR